MKYKAAFLDRDGIIINLAYDKEQGSIYTPLNPKEVELTFGIVPFLKKARKLGYKLIIISNQPDVGLGRMSAAMFDAVRTRMEELLLRNGIALDAQYYCLHHPFAKIKKYRKNCICRKPKTGLFKKAAREHDISLGHSIMVGDGISDVLAGKTAGCKTVFVTNVTESGYLAILEKQLRGQKPDYIVKNLGDAASLL